ASPLWRGSTSPREGADTKEAGRLEPAHSPSVFASGSLTAAYFHLVPNPVSRRDFIKGVSLLALARLIPPSAWEAVAEAATETFAFFTAHQAAVVREATARIIPGPTDDPLETGHPGAREANV